MCGIAGVLDLTGPPSLELLTRMISRVPHRGPDGSGIYRDEQVGLAHARLAIIDAAGGAQPMSDHEGEVWITFNGEIFNYLELRQELTGLGHRFRTASDTEVLLHAWQEWGQRCFERCNGQWAAAAPRARPGPAGGAAVVLLARPGPLPVRLGGQVDLRRSAGAAGVRPRRPRRCDDLLEPCGAPDGLRRHRTVAAGASGDRGR